MVEHRPGHTSFRATDYVPIGVFYQGQRPDLLAQFGADNAVHDKALGGAEPVEGPWRFGRRCDHCENDFSVGVAYRHVPSGRILHVDKPCADRTFDPPALAAETVGSIEELRHRWQAWRRAQEPTFLWRIGEEIERGIASARSDLASALADASLADPDDKATEMRLNRRLDRGVIFGPILVLASLIVCAIVIIRSTDPDIWWWATAPVLVLLFWVLFLIVQVRNLARLRFRVRHYDERRIAAMERAQHDGRELARLVVARRQFNDWQAIIREVVHAPFGRLDRSTSLRDADLDVERPQSFLLAHARPTPDQLAAAQLRARKQTVHVGWLSQIYGTTRRAWMENYRRIRIAGEFEDLRPESDNAGSASVVGHWQGDPVLYPRADFRRRLTGGDLRSAVIDDRIDVIVDALSSTELNGLLASVEIDGPGGALRGGTPDAFLGGLAARPVPEFAADLFLGGSLTLRERNVDRSEPSATDPGGSVHRDSLGPGRTFTAVSWRMDFSLPVRPDLGASWGGNTIEPSKDPEASSDPESPV